MRTDRLRRWATAVALVLATGVLIALGLRLHRMGLEAADRLSSVIAMFAGVLALAATGWALLQNRTAARANPRRPARHRTAWGRLRLRDDVRRLLEATWSASDRSANPLLGGRRTAVSTVYVRQRLEQPRWDEIGKRRARLTDDQLFLPFDQQPRVVPVRRPLDQVFDQHRHLLIEGGPGTGKSTTARQICRQLAAAWLTGDDAGRGLTAQPLLPLLVTARALAAQIESTWPEALAAAAFGPLGLSALDRVQPHLVAGAVDGVDWLVIIDGLDEVPGDERDTLIERLSTWTSVDDRPYRLLITTRPLAGHVTSMLGIGAIGHYTLLPFDKEALRDFAHRWCGDPAPAGRFLGEIAAANLEEVAAVPLMATIAIHVFDFDPRQGLPRNRHDLYEKCLVWLAETSGERSRAGRAELDALMSGHAGGAPAVARLYDEADDLLEELAVARVDGRRPLLPIALDWLGGHQAQPGRRPEDWHGRVVEALAGTGLVTRRGDGLDFIHLTFAEHLAARRYAREMPAGFNPADPAWRRWTHRAARDEPVAMAVLTRWTRDHDATALLDWLLSGDQGQQKTAVRLVAEGAAPSTGQLSACLRAVDRGLRMRYRFEPETMTSLVRRFPDAPDLAGWLDRLLAAFTGQPRVWAAVAAVVAHRYPDRRPAIVDQMRRRTRDPASPADQLIVAEVLDDVHPAGAGATAAHLSALTASGTVPIDDRARIALYLVGRDGWRTAAMDVLREVLHEPRAEATWRRAAAEALIEWGADSRDDVLEQMRQALLAPALTGFDRVELADTMVAVAPGSRARAVEEIRAVMHDGTATEFGRRWAGRRLAALGAEHREEVAAWLTAWSTQPGHSTRELLSTAEALGELGEAHWDTVAAIVARAAGEAATRPRDDWFVVTSTSLDGALQQTLVARLHRLAEAAGPDVEKRCFLRAATAGLDPRGQDAVAEFIGLLLDGHVTVQDLDAAGRYLAFCAPSRIDAVGERLLSLAEAGSVDLTAEVLVDVGEALLPFARHLDAALSLLLRVATDPHSPADVAGRAAEESLTASVGTQTGTAVAALSRLGRLPSVPAYRRQTLLEAAVRATPDGADGSRALLDDAHAELSDLNWQSLAGPVAPPERRAHALSRLLERLADPATWPFERLRLARGLLESEPGHRSTALAALASVVADVHAPGVARAQGAVLLIRHEPAADTRCRDVLRDLVGDRYRPVAERLDILWEQAGVTAVADRRIPPGLIDELDRLPGRAVHTGALTRLPRIATVALDPIRDFLARRLEQRDPAGPEASSAATFLSHGDGYRIGQGERLARAAASDDPRRVRPLAQAAVAAAPELRPAAGELLWRLVRDASCGPDDRAAALETLTDLGPGDCATAVELLRTYLVPRTRIEDYATRYPAVERIDAAGVLLRKIVTQRNTAAAALRDVLADRTATHWHRDRAVRLLADGGPEARALAAASYRSTVVDPSRALAERTSSAQRLLETRWDAAPDVLAMLRPVLERAGRPSHRFLVARAMVAADPGDRSALAALTALITEAPADLRSARDAAELLAGGSVAHRAQLAHLLAPVLTGPRIPAGAVVRFAGFLGDADDSAVAQVVERLLAVTADPSVRPALRVAAAVDLYRFGDARRPAQDSLHAMAMDPVVPAYLRVTAAEILLTRYGPHHDSAREILLTLTGGADDRARAAACVLRFDGPDSVVRFRGEESPAAGLLAESLAGGDLSAHQRLSTAVELGAHGDTAHRQAAVTSLWQLADDPRVHPWLRSQAVSEIPAIDHRQAGECVRRLWQVVTDHRAVLDRRRWAAEALSDVTSEVGGYVRDELRQLDGDHLDPRERRRLRRSLAYVDDGGRTICDPAAPEQAPNTRGP